MTNDPDYKFHVTNLNQYVNINNPTEYKNYQIDSEEYGAIPEVIGHGFNLKGLPYDISPASRFVRIFYLKQISLHNRKLVDETDCIAYASGILSTLFIVKGAVTPDKFIRTSEETQFMVMKDNNMKVF